MEFNDLVRVVLDKHRATTDWPQVFNFEKDVDTMASFDELAKRSAEMQQQASFEGAAQHFRPASQAGNFSVAAQTPQNVCGIATGIGSPFNPLRPESALGRQEAFEFRDQVPRGPAASPVQTRATGFESDYIHSRRHAVAFLAAQAAKDKAVEQGGAPAKAADDVVQAYIKAWDAMEKVK